PAGDVDGEAGIGVPAVVVEEQHHVALARGHPGVAAGRDADVLRQPDGPHPGGQPGHVGAVAHHDQFHLGAVLGQHAVDGPDHLGRAVAHGEDDAGQGEGALGGGGHRNLLDATMASRCATVISTPTASAATVSTRVAARPPAAASAIAASRMRTDSSTAWMMRCTRIAEASRRASASPRERGASASSSCLPPSPEEALATITVSVSALIKVAQIAAARPALT